MTVLRPEPYSMVYCAIPYALEGLFPADKTFKKDDLVTEVGANLVRLKASRVDAEAQIVRSRGRAPPSAMASCSSASARPQFARPWQAPIFQTSIRSKPVKT